MVFGWIRACMPGQKQHKAELAARLAVMCRKNIDAEIEEAMRTFARHLLRFPVEEILRRLKKVAGEERIPESPEKK